MAFIVKRVKKVFTSFEGSSPSQVEERPLPINLFIISQQKNLPAIYHPGWIIKKHFVPETVPTKKVSVKKLSETQHFEITLVDDYEVIVKFFTPEGAYRTEESIAGALEGFSYKRVFFLVFSVHDKNFRKTWSRCHALLSSTVLNLRKYPVFIIGTLNHRGRNHIERGVIRGHLELMEKVAEKMDVKFREIHLGDDDGESVEKALNEVILAKFENVPEEEKGKKSKKGKGKKDKKKKKKNKKMETEEKRPPAAAPRDMAPPIVHMDVPTDSEDEMDDDEALYFGSPGRVPNRPDDVHADSDSDSSVDSGPGAGDKLLVVNRYFGVKLSASAKPPNFIKAILRYIERNPASRMFIKGCSPQNRKVMVRQIESGGMLSDMDDFNVYELCDVLKVYLREYPRSILDKAILGEDGAGAGQSEDQIVIILHSCYQPHFQILKLLCGVLYRLTTKLHKVTGLTARDLAYVFAPLLVGPDHSLRKTGLIMGRMSQIQMQPPTEELVAPVKLVRNLIFNYDYFFENSPTLKELPKEVVRKRRESASLKRLLAKGNKTSDDFFKGLARDFIEEEPPARVPKRSELPPVELEVTRVPEPPKAKEKKTKEDEDEDEKSHGGHMKMISMSDFDSLKSSLETVDVSEAQNVVELDDIETEIFRSKKNRGQKKSSFATAEEAQAVVGELFERNAVTESVELEQQAVEMEIPKPKVEKGEEEQKVVKKEKMPKEINVKVDPQAYQAVFRESFEEGEINFEKVMNLYFEDEDGDKCSVLVKSEGLSIERLKVKIAEELELSSWKKVGKILKKSDRTVVKRTSQLKKLRNGDWLIVNYVE